MPKIDIETMEWGGGSGYPSQFASAVEGRMRKRLGNEAGLSQFGVNLAKLEPGAASALRHWHENEDEFVYVLEGEAVLVEDDGETVLKPGDAAGFKAGVANGHHLINRGQSDLLYLEIGSRMPAETAHYPEHDLVAIKNDEGFKFTNKKGEPYA